MYEVKIAFFEKLGDITAGMIRKVFGVPDHHLSQLAKVSALESHGLRVAII
jgi:hypothetical protein